VAAAEETFVRVVGKRRDIDPARIRRHRPKICFSAELIVCVQSSSPAALYFRKYGVLVADAP
jgi:hypothetical protein